MATHNDLRNAYARLEDLADKLSHDLIEADLNERDRTFAAVMILTLCDGVADVIDWVENGRGDDF